MKCWDKVYLSFFYDFIILFDFYRVWFENYKFLSLNYWKFAR